MSMLSFNNLCAAAEWHSGCGSHSGEQPLAGLCFFTKFANVVRGQKGLKMNLCPLFRIYEGHCVRMVSTSLADK